MLTVIGCKVPNAAPHSRMRLFQHRIEHRREIAGRGIDNLQHLGGRGLLLQRLPLLGQQPRVLDRDHRLIGEGADELDLPVGERLDPLARKTMTPIASPSRNSGTPSDVRCLPSLMRFRIARNGGHVVNMHDAAFAHGPALPTLGESGVKRKRAQSPAVGLVFRRKPEIRGQRA